MAKSLRKDIEARLLARRSAAYRWLHDHYAELAPLLSQRRPPWTVLAEKAKASGDAALSRVTRQAMYKAGTSLLADKAASGSTEQRQTKARQQPQKAPPHVECNRSATSQPFTKPKTGKSIWDTE